jgi:hypothetical protein
MHSPKTFPIFLPFHLPSTPSVKSGNVPLQLGGLNVEVEGSSAAQN